MKRLRRPGFRNDVSPSEYLADPCAVPSLNASTAHILVAKSPLHAYHAHPRLGGRLIEPTPAMLLGSLIHALILGKGYEQFLVAQFDSWRTNEAKAAKEYIAKQGKTAVLPHQMLQAQGIAKAMTKNIKAALADAGWTPLCGRSEVVAIWEEDGIMCRGMMDKFSWRKAIIFDLKTTTTADPQTVSAKLIREGNDIAAAAYLSAVGHILPSLAGRVEMIFLFCEVEEPYAVTPMAVSSGLLALGQWKWNKAKRLWAECRLSKRWPGYKACAASPPMWAFNQMLEEAPESEIEVDIG